MRNLKTDILATNMNRRAMAREIGISPTTVCKIASGSIPDMITLRKITTWLGTKPEDYVGLDQKSLCARIAQTQMPLAQHIIYANEKWQQSGIKSIGHE